MIDISNVTNPQSYQTISTTGLTTSMQLVDNGYVLMLQKRYINVMQFFFWLDPYHRKDFKKNINSFQLIGDLLFLAVDSVGLMTYAVDKIQSPVLLETYSLHGSPLEVIVAMCNMDPTNWVAYVISSYGLEVLSLNNIDLYATSKASSYASSTTQVILKAFETDPNVAFDGSSATTTFAISVGPVIRPQYNPIVMGTHSVFPGNVLSLTISTSDMFLYQGSYTIVATQYSGQPLPSWVRMFLAPVLTGNFAQFMLDANDVTITDGVAYIVTDTILMAYDLNPNIPRRLWVESFAPGDTPLSVSVRGIFVYVLSSYVGITIYDASDPYDVWWYGNYITDGATRAIISELISLIPATTYVQVLKTDSLTNYFWNDWSLSFIGSVYAMALVGSNALIITINSPTGCLVQMLDVSTPAYPTLLGSMNFNDYNSLYDVKVVNNTVAYIGTDSSVVALNITSYSEMTILQVTNIYSRAITFYVNTDLETLYVAGDLGLVLVDISDPTNINFFAVFFDSQYDYDVLPVDPYNAFVVGAGGLTLIDTYSAMASRVQSFETNSSMPEFNSYDYLYSYYTIYLNVSCDEVFSSTDPFLYRFACSMAEVNNVLYIATTTGIVILDVSNIYSPTSIGFWSDPVGADYYLRMVNGMLYATGGIGFLVFNITNASSPEVLSRISANYGKFELVQGFLYITSSLTTAVSMPLMIFDLNLIIQDPPGIL